MSVYRRAGREGYSYDFQTDGRRFSGRLEATNRRDAEAEEKRIKAQVRADLDRTRRRARAPMTWGEACRLYVEQVASLYRGRRARQKCEAALAWLTLWIGADTPLAAIGNRTVSDLVARRRGDGVAPATVNRSCTEPLRRVLNRAAKVWEEEVAPIDWRQHVLGEPQERVRELGADEEARLFASLRPDYHAIVRFALASGVRLAGCLALTWSDIDWQARRIRIRGKGERDYTVPLSTLMQAILSPLRGRHETAVFTYVVQRTRDGRTAGACLPITESGLSSEWRRAKADAGLENFRFHDTRHTRATRLLRRTGNLKQVQKLLGHSRIETTARYAHVTEDDLLAALDAESHQNSHRPRAAKIIRQ
ncbi:hypothetical protein ABB55_27610 [Prosthecomicrobium hirschii]|uniref:Tyr recombinase domain-containing protein n=1 Tax=Prosthecodimorpha hirschii TaxID=665126 RepID=A0A0P6VW56_9HYPH|nr:site-specific integrase [Prosthecomicrobium hirschii]KPL55535.1 hypothetical protein ABB55_27610 [Prosthecomicrobium hirschii]